MNLKFKLLHPHAKPPTRGTVGAAAMDLYACESITIYPMNHDIVDVGVGFEIPSGFFGLVAQRSGLASRGIDIFGGIVDSDYRGAVKAFLFNGSDAPWSISVGDRIAQMVILPHACPSLIEGELGETERGDKGLGSTGK